MAGSRGARGTVPDLLARDGRVVITVRVLIAALVLAVGGCTGPGFDPREAAHEIAVSLQAALAEDLAAGRDVLEDVSLALILGDLPRPEGVQRMALGRSWGSGERDGVLRAEVPVGIIPVEVEPYCAHVVVTSAGDASAVLRPGEHPLGAGGAPLCGDGPDPDQSP